MNEARAIARCEAAALLPPGSDARRCNAGPSQAIHGGVPSACRTAPRRTAARGRGHAAVLRRGQPVTPRDLAQMVDAVTDYSRYACAETLRQGFLCLHGGFRLGVCGTAVLRNGAVASLRDISSLCCASSPSGSAWPSRRQTACSAREPSEHAPALTAGRRQDDASARPHPHARSEARPPGAARRGGGRARRDRRLRRRGSADGVGDAHGRAHALPKAQGIGMVLRAMNPQVIAVDEITAAEDIAAMAHAANCGAALLATMHASGLDELRQKPLWPLLRATGVFSRAVIIEGTGEAGGTAWRSCCREAARSRPDPLRRGAQCHALLGARRQERAALRELSAALEGLGAGYAPRSCRCRGCSGSARRGEYADAFFADVLAQLENGTPLPDGWWRRPPPGRRSASGAGCAIRSCRRARRGGRTRCSAPLRAAAQALRGTLMERERQNARDTRLVTTLCFSLSLLVTILLI